jgi:hypothetical protein
MTRAVWQTRRPLMTKKKAAKKTRAPKKHARHPSTVSESPVIDETVGRLQQLAQDLAAASQEAERIAEVVTTDLAHEMVDHNLDPAAKKGDRSG